MEITRLEDLQGAKLTDVCFVMDYIQLGFSGSLLACFGRPCARVQQKVFRFPETGCRDAFCSFIGQTLHNIQLKDDQFILLEFAGGSIEVPLNEPEIKGESASFSPGLNRPV